MPLLIFFGIQRSFLAIFTPKFETSTTPTMAGSLQTAAQPPPNPTNTITNASATGGGVVVGDSAAIAVTITAEASHKWTGDRTDGTNHLWTEGQGPERPHQTTQSTQQSIGMRVGVSWVKNNEI